MAASTERSKSRPMTEAIDNARSVSSPKFGHALGHHLADAGGEPDFVEVDRQSPDAVVALGEGPLLGQVNDHLDNEEGVPPGLSPQGVGQGHPVVGQPCARRLLP